MAPTSSPPCAPPALAKQSSAPPSPDDSVVVRRTTRGEGRTFPQLTERERAILDGVAAGLSNAQIGQREFLSAKTVANNVSNILGKLHLSERGQAIVMAREAGLGRTTQQLIVTPNESGVKPLRCPADLPD